MQYTEIIITYRIDSYNQLDSITFIDNGVIVTSEPFDFKYHSEYLKLDITKFESYRTKYCIR
jgi:hypothetical protein